MAATGRLLAFGEILLRLSPPGHRLLRQATTLDLWVGGAEANVATQLALLGHDVAFASRVPDNDLGRMAIAALRGAGVDVRAIQTGGDRMGLYFATMGGGARAGAVIYDRAGSAFAEAPAESWDWDSLLRGVTRLHLSGITPALGPVPAASALAAVEAAAARGVPVSFDGNWRGQLWARWDADPRALLLPIVAHADLMFGNHRDIALLLGDGGFKGDGEDHRRRACEAAFAAFPRLDTIASTVRQVVSADTHRLSARIDRRDGDVRTEPVTLTGVVDRIGGGDAFAAGVLHALARDRGMEQAARTGLALAALKHSLPGDSALFGQADIDAYLGGHHDVRR